MLICGVICMMVFGAANSAFSQSGGSSSSGNGRQYVGGYAGGSAGNGFAGGSAGGSAGSDGYAPQYNNYYNENYDPYAFHSYLSGLNFAHANQAAVSYAYASPQAYAHAKASLMPDNDQIQQQIAQQQAQNQYFHEMLTAQIQAQNGFLQNQAQSGSFASGGGTPHYTGASASFGPGGVHQTSFVNPPNLQSPNVDTRFDTQGPSNGGQFGISTSSFSSSTNLDGVEKRKGGSITTVNDNGKVTTYETHS